MTLRVDDGMAIIDVEDNGKGFPRENRARLLEPYMTTRAEGTGLGLPIVAKILEDHGGGIELLDALPVPARWCASISPSQARNNKPRAFCTLARKVERRSAWRAIF